MKWFTHKAVALAGALAVQAPLGGLLGVLAGSILPDVIDMTISRGDRSLWRRIHRQSSHWFGWYLILIALGCLVPIGEGLGELVRSLGISFPGVSHKMFVSVGDVGNEIVVWIGIGGLVHVLLDGLTPMGIPVGPFGGKRRFKMPIVSTGTWKETVFLICALGCIALQFESARFVFETALRHFRI